MRMASNAKRRAEVILRVFARVLVFSVVLGSGYYLGRPVYWAIQSRIHDFRDSLAAGSHYEVEDEQQVGHGVLDPDLLSSQSSNSASDGDKTLLSLQEKSETKPDVSSTPQETKSDAIISQNQGTEQPETKNDSSLTATSTEVTAVAQKPFAKGVRSIIHEGRPLSPRLKYDIWDKAAVGPDIPAKEEFSLRRELVEFRAKDNVIVVTFANFAFMDFVTTWVRHLTENGVFNILVGAMDHKILEGLYLEGVPVFDMESGMSTIDVGWGTPIFHKMGREKITLINVFLSMDFEILICDTDMVFIQNPLPWVARWPGADVLTSSDETRHTITDDGLELWDRAMAAYNIGILLYRPTDPAKRQAREWAELLASDDKIWDQNGFNDLMRQKLGPGLDNGRGLFYAYDGTLKLGIMPVSLFCSGHTYFIQGLPKLVGMKPYAVHTTYQFAGTPGKRHRLREAKLFFDKPEYYDPPGGLLSFTLDLPQELLSGGEHTLHSHFALVNYQLLRIRTALAIATILGRTLIFPELWCRFDRMWYPIPGILPGTATPQPLLCPLDHVFEVHHMAEGDSLPEYEFGPNIPFREYSFLDNPRVPEQVTKSRLEVGTCQRGSEGCPLAPSAQVAGESKVLRLAENSTQNEIEELLLPFKDVKVLHFSSMENVFGKWNDQSREKKFVKRIKTYLGIWCCVDKQPGHIWYDFYWDTRPDYEPRPPRNWTEDHPPL